MYVSGRHHLVIQGNLSGGGLRLTALRPVRLNVLINIKCISLPFFIFFSFSSSLFLLLSLFFSEEGGAREEEEEKEKVEKEASL